MSVQSTIVVSSADIEQAERRLRPFLRITGVRPLSTNRAAMAVKQENDQTTGSFKIRGALNALLVLRERGAARGIVTTSSGNHGIAVARAAAIVGMRATVVVPPTAPECKVQAIARCGADLVTAVPAQMDIRAREIRDSDGLEYLACDSPDVIAGQGTVGREIVWQCPDVERIYLPVGTGSLAAGVAIAVRRAGLAVRVIGVEPLLAADAYASLRAGRLIAWPCEATYRTCADGLRVPQLGATAWSIIQHLVDDIVLVSEAEIAEAARALWLGYQVVAEPSGATAVAAMRRSLGLGPAVAVVTGGNADDAWRARVGCESA